MKKIIINADDLFLNEKINSGIGELIDRGIVTSVSVIVNMNYSPKKFKAFYNGHPNASYGLHVNVTEGFPLSNTADVKSLIDRRGRFYRTRVFLFKVHIMDPSEMRREIEMQIKYFKKSGVPLTHIDSHSHIFWVSGIMRKLQIELAMKNALPTRFPKVTDVNKNGILFKILRLYLNLHKNNMINRIKMPDALIDLFGRSIDNNSVMCNINAIKNGISELLTHPGYSCCGKFRDREKQQMILKSDWFKDLIVNYNLKLCNYNELAR